MTLNIVQSITCDGCGKTANFDQVDAWFNVRRMFGTPEGLVKLAENQLEAAPRDMCSTACVLEWAKGRVVIDDLEKKWGQNDGPA